MNKKFSKVIKHLSKTALLIISLLHSKCWEINLKPFLKIKPQNL
jgi:hypothetical protein